MTEVSLEDLLKRSREMWLLTRELDSSSELISMVTDVTPAELKQAFEAGFDAEEIAEFIFDDFPLAIAADGVFVAFEDKRQMNFINRNKKILKGD